MQQKAQFQKSLALYHRAYRNDHYSAVTDEIVYQLGSNSDATDEEICNSKEYIQLSNLVTDVALEICGYPFDKSAGWELAEAIREIFKPYLKAGHLKQSHIDGLVDVIDGYLGQYRYYMREYGDKDSVIKASQEPDLSGFIQQASTEANWSGRLMYHFYSAADLLVRTAAIIKQDPHSKSQLLYAAEKLTHAMRHIGYGLSEIMQHAPAYPLIFAKIRSQINDIEE